MIFGVGQSGFQFAGLNDFVFHIDAKFLGKCLGQVVLKSNRISVIVSGIG